MVRTVVTPRVILAGVALLVTVVNIEEVGDFDYIHLLTQKLSQDMMTIKTAGV